MQGLNFNFDSTYIQNTIHETDKSLNLEQNGSQISFMDLIRSEVKKNEQSENLNESVQKTDKDVSENKADIKDESSKEVTSNKEVQKADKNENSNTEGIEKTSEDKLDNKEVRPELVIINQSQLKNTKEQKVKLSSQSQKIVELNKINSEEKNKNDLNILNENNISLEKIISQKEKDVDFSDELNNVQFLGQSNSQVNFEKNDDAKNLLSSFDAKQVKVKKDQKKLSDVISVTDLRTEKNNIKEIDKSDFVTSVKQTSKDSVQVTMDLTNTAEKNILSLDNQSASSVSSTFQAMLENQISENAIDFVKAGKIVLKDNNMGKIDLILHPESLGNVKISLELSDKVITGKILVSSQEAFKAFNSTQDNLRNAFIENGFDAANFDVAYSNHGQGFSNGSQHQPQHNAQQIEKAYENFVLENGLVEENNSDINTDIRNYSINFVA